MDVTHEDQVRMYRAYLRSTRSCLKGLKKQEVEAGNPWPPVEDHDDPRYLAWASWSEDLKRLLENPVV